jgi:PKD repeat protein
MACGDYGLVVVSNDGGTTWTSQTVGVDIWHDFGWDSPDHVFVCGTPGLVYESWDGGVTWQNANPQGAGQSALYECTFTSDYHGFICGSQGVLLKRDPSCGAGFSASLATPCTGDSVTFTDESWGNVSSWSWVFEGGTPPASSDPNPVVVYNAPGTYDVTLTVSNPWWSNTLSETNYISAAQSPPAPAITANGNTLSSNMSGGNQWYLNGQLIGGATGQTYEATASGLYWDVAVQGSCSSDTSNNIYLIMTGISDHIGKGLILSPVPNKGRFTVSMPGYPVSPWTVQIFNNMGLCIFSVPCLEIGGPVSESIDLGNVPAGIYTMVVSGIDRMVVRLMVVR